MAHVAHYKMADVRRLANEWTRDKKYKCKDGRIDAGRTPGNYIMDDSLRYGMMARSSYTLMSVLRSRLNEVTHSNRKDLNVISEWVVTCPQELKNDPEKVKRFFEITYSFVGERYGRENVLQGFVHVDETTPHIHIPIIPVKDGRVSSKAVFTRKELSSFHNELDKVVAAEFGQKGLIRNGRTKGNYTIAELKQRTKDEEEIARRRLQNARERTEGDKAVQRRLEAEKAAEAALEAKRGAEEKMRDIQEKVRAIIEEARHENELSKHIRSYTNEATEKIMLAAQTVTGEDGRPLSDILLEQYIKDGGQTIPRTTADRKARAARRAAELEELESSYSEEKPEHHSHTYTQYNG